MIDKIKKMGHYWRRLRLLIDSGYYPEFLRHQGVRIGKDTVVYYPSYVDGRTPYLLEIGNNVVISINVTILTHDATSAYAGDLIKVGPVTIRDHCFIGANSTILCNVTIGPDSIVGAGSIVSRDIPANSVYAGNPARFVCTVEEFTAKHAEYAKTHPFMEARYFTHPYISDKRKMFLKEKVKDSFVYFCATLPEGNKYNRVEVPAEDG